MEPGSSSDRLSKPKARPGPWSPRIELFIPANTNFNPRDLKSWAKRTGSTSSPSRGSIRSESLGGADLTWRRGLGLRSRR
ncbi:uncharacterized protein A4U43_C04F28360 [Asparagus officinalis]|uniref:Uncharacterized protein n=1 Tax=Asparagus officinalis TaxID=4686 RepID=A0A5P1F618_ASPOF|nr:uncharacterized protein A4U43_C04F28360 [Asparagus officinalis]